MPSSSITHEFKPGDWLKVSPGHSKFFYYVLKSLEGMVKESEVYLCKCYDAHPHVMTVITAPRFFSEIRPFFATDKEILFILGSDWKIVDIYGRIV